MQIWCVYPRNRLAFEEEPYRGHVILTKDHSLNLLQRKRLAIWEPDVEEGLEHAKIEKRIKRSMEACY
jgi:hypothetical protein